MRSREEILEDLVVEAFELGACDAQDIFLFTKSYLDVDFDEVNEIVESLWGPINCSTGAPTWATLQ